MKLHLCAATALVSIMMLTSAGGAEPAPSKVPAPPAAAVEQQKLVKSDKPRLSDEKDQILKAAIAKARADNKQINDQIKDKRKELAALMKAEKFDKAAFLAKNAEMQELMAKASRARTEALATVAEKFSAQDRKILAERFEKGKEARAGHGMNRAPDKKEK
jgi:uncharacterized membrane protein